MASSREKGIEGQGLECTKVISSYFMQADLQRSYLWGTLIKSLENKGHELCGFEKEEHSRY